MNVIVSVEDHSQYGAERRIKRITMTEYLTSFVRGESRRKRPARGLPNQRLVISDVRFFLPPIRHERNGNHRIDVHESRANHRRKRNFACVEHALNEAKIRSSRNVPRISLMPIMLATMTTPRTTIAVAELAQMCAPLKMAPRRINRNDASRPGSGTGRSSRHAKM